MRRYSVVLAQNVALQQNSAPEGHMSLVKLKVREYYVRHRVREYYVRHQPPG